MEKYYIRKTIEPEEIYFRGTNVNPANLSKIRTD